LCCPDGWQCNADMTCVNPFLVLTPNSNLFNGGE
jgi:hypothetical protein